VSIEFNNISFSYDDSKSSIFKNISIDLPGGMTTLVGQNGTGKSTFLLLAGGRLYPEKGTVCIDSKDSRDFIDEEDRNHLVSFIYQNMEFETEDNIASLLDFVFQQGALENASIISEIVKEFELEKTLNKKFQENSKGDMQKISIAFSLLYGSPYIMMDEPVFSLDNYWKEKILAYLKNYTESKGISLYYSIHELDLSQKYSDNALLFSKDSSILMGPAVETLTQKFLEEAYQVPMELLYKRENLFRAHLEAPADFSNLNDMKVKIIE